MANYILTDEGKLYSTNNISDDELMHYGVLGMKWGIRRAQKRGDTYQYRSMGQKKYTKKLAKQTAKGASADKIAKSKTKLETFKTRDKNRQSYAEKTTVGKSVVKGLLVGAMGSGTYNRLRSAGQSKLVSAGGAAASVVFSPLAGLAISKVAENSHARTMNKERNGDK